MAWEAVGQDHHQIKGWRQGAQCVKNSVQHLHVLYIWKSSSKVSWSRQFATNTCKRRPPYSSLTLNDLGTYPFTLPMSVESPGTYWLKYRCIKRSQKGLVSSDKCFSNICQVFRLKIHPPNHGDVRMHSVLFCIPCVCVVFLPLFSTRRKAGGADLLSTQSPAPAARLGWFTQSPAQHQRPTPWFARRQRALSALWQHAQL